MSGRHRQRIHHAIVLARESRASSPGDNPFIAGDESVRLKKVWSAATRLVGQGTVAGAAQLSQEMYRNRGGSIATMHGEADSARALAALRKRSELLRPPQPVQLLLRMWRSGSSPVDTLSF